VESNQIWTLCSSVRVSKQALNTRLGYKSTSLQLFIDINWNLLNSTVWCLISNCLTFFQWHNLLSRHLRSLVLFSWIVTTGAILPPIAHYIMHATFRTLKYLQWEESTMIRIPWNIFIFFFIGVILTYFTINYCNILWNR